MTEAIIKKGMRVLISLEKSEVIYWGFVEAVDDEKIVISNPKHPYTMVKWGAIEKIEVQEVEG
jgi:ABC-type oligopeptide transport system ATPase subunit